MTFGIAPAFLIAIHTSDVGVWRPYAATATILAIAYAAAALARLVYFTARAHHLPHFLGVPTPQSVLALVVALLFHDTPAFQGVQPIGVLTGVAILSVMMVVPVPYPKIRRGAKLRGPMTATAVFAAVTLVLLQFSAARTGPLYSIAEVAAYGLLVGVASYYLLGPFTTRPAAAAAP